MKFKVIDKFSKKYYFLSNMYPCKIEYKGFIFDCAEAAFQAQKRPSMAFAFVGIDGYTARKRGRNIMMSKEELDHWEIVKRAEMFDILYAKFTQNTELWDMLNNTGDAILVEGNDWGDKFWGVCKGEGRNILGGLLALVRKATVVSRTYNKDGVAHVNREEFSSGIFAKNKLHDLDNVGIEAYTVINGRVYKNETLENK